MRLKEFAEIVNEAYHKYGDVECNIDIDYKVDSFDIKDVLCDSRSLTVYNYK